MMGGGGPGGHQGGGWGPPPPGGFGQPPQAPPPYAPPQPGYPPQHGYGPPQVYAIANPFGLVCPRCQGQNITKPSFTWWGGILGPKLLNHAVCGGCGFGFNAKTGKSNTTGIAIYYGVIFGVVIVLTLVSALAR